MEPETKRRLETYLSSLTRLFSQIKSWVQEKGLTVEESEIELEEPRPGRYKAPKLVVSDLSGQPLAEIRPMGAWIIGADGRVDIVGHLEKEPLVYWAAGAPEIAPPESANAVTHRTRLFKGAEKEGWYWIEDKIRGKAHLLDSDIFMDLIREVQPL